MTDLYAELGVARDAGAADIRRAYRSRAKLAHPDGGGSVDVFQRLATAVAVLTDARRRRAYDETGRVEDAPLDDLDARALQFLFGQIEHALAGVEARGLRLDDVDVVDSVRQGLRQKLSEIDGVEQGARRRQEQAERVAARFRAARGGVDRIGPMFRAKAAAFARNVAACARDREMVRRAVEILGEHQWR